MMRSLLGRRLKSGISWVFFLALFLASFASSRAAQDKHPIQPGPFAPAEIRLKVKPGQILPYRLKLAGHVGWTPPIDSVNGGRMATDFLFTLRAKTHRPNGDWTFDLFGEQLHSAGRNQKGYFNVLANRNRAKVKVDTTRHAPRRIECDTSLLEKPMTLTLGPRGQIRYGTGLLPLAIYMLPHVDHHFWTLLTTAPEAPVEPGTEQIFDFEVPLPGVKGNPLHVKAQWKVLQRRPGAARDVREIALAAELDLVGTSVLLQNGDQFRVVAGTYKAGGMACWDVEAGRLRSATANQTILVTTDQPIRRILRSDCHCSLEWMGPAE
ncbi:MAG: hypothetical protein JW829_10510 [Pirellulales bacterium]|nr:hypothetical protein [Pirellulales bacterium]